jgi:hypothetical protein
MIAMHLFFREVAVSRLWAATLDLWTLPPEGFGMWDHLEQPGRHNKETNPKVLANLYGQERWPINLEAKKNQKNLVWRGYNSCGGSSKRDFGRWFLCE